jgi:hypothetical protein
MEILGQNGKNESLCRRHAARIKPKLVAIPWTCQVQRRRRRNARAYREGIVSCAPLTLIYGTGKTLIANPRDNGNANINVSDQHGAIIPAVSLKLIFWGTAWAQLSNVPTGIQVSGRVQEMLVGPYTSALRQYRVGFGRSPPIDEIGDVCTNTVSRFNGVAVQGYWSQFDCACEIPLAFSLRRFLLLSGRNLSQGLRIFQPLVTKGSSVGA